MADQKNEAEKRGASRVQKNLIIQFSFDSEPGVRKWDVSAIRDIGEKGVSFNVAQNFPIGSTVHMLIKIPLKPFEWFEVTGKLVGITETKVNADDALLNTALARVSFLDLEDAQKALIHEYVAWCLNKYGGKK